MKIVMYIEERKKELHLQKEKDIGEEKKSDSRKIMRKRKKEKGKKTDKDS